MAASTTLTPAVLFQGQMTTAAADLTTGPSTSVRWLVSALYLTNLTTGDVTATLGNKMSTSVTRYHAFGTTIEKNKGIAFGPLIMTSTGAGITVNASAASAIDVIAYGLTEAI